MINANDRRESRNNNEIKNYILQRSIHLSTKLFRGVERENVVTASATTAVWYKI